MSVTRLAKPLFWVGSSRKDLRGFPDPVKDVVGHALLDLIKERLRRAEQDHASWSKSGE